MKQHANSDASAVITPEDVDLLNKRIMDLSEAVTRNVVHARVFGDDVDDVVDNILFDVRYALVEAWAGRFFPELFTGITAAEAGKFNLDGFELFRAKDLVDDVLFGDEFDREVARRQRIRRDADDLKLLNAGETAFRADRNPVTTVLQFSPGRYSVESDAKKWFRGLNDPEVRAFGVFAELVPDKCVEDSRVRFVPFGRNDPSTETSVFLGWAFRRGEAEPDEPAFEFGKRFGAISGFEDAKFDEDDLNCSTFGHSVGRKWTETVF